MGNLALGFLGPLQVMAENAPIPALISDKSRALLVYLAVESAHPHRRAALLGLLWPDSPEEVARRNLRQTLYLLRQVIGDQAADPPYLLISRDEIQFNAASDYTLDVEAFMARIAAADAHRHSNLETCSSCADLFQEAVALYRGKFLEEFFLKDSAEFEEWALIHREALHRCALEALGHLANYHEQRREYEQARGYVQRQLAFDPWREDAHRQMMRLLTQSGQRAAALVQYESCRRVLAEELGVEPSVETRVLYEQIKADEQPPLEKSRAPSQALAPEAEPGVNASVPSPQAPPPATEAHYDLPVQLTPFVGREHELSQLGQLLANPECRLLTLVGPGGIGKTRLALQLAAQWRAVFVQGVAFVPLTSTPAPELIATTIAAAVHFSFHDVNDPRLPLLNFLAGREMLLVLDDVEHLLEGARFFAEILQSAPRVKLLVTSREQLSMQEEWVFEVQGLAVPENEQAEGFEGWSAVSLFLQRARRARLGFVLQAAERAAVGRICHMVEGMPLGLELAATWVRVLSCAEIAEQIAQNLDFLATSMRDVPERHRSMRAVFDQSWSMLSAEERRVLSNLSVFRGGFTREAAERVAGASLSVLAALIIKSLMRRSAGDRYDLHKLTRQYAEARLAESSEPGRAFEDHLSFFLELAEEAERELHGARQLAWLDRLERDRDNLRAALEWALAGGHTESGDPQANGRAAQRTLRLASALYFFWRRRSHWREGRDWIKRALAQSAAGPGTIARAKALNVAVLLALEQADTWEAGLLSDENRTLAGELGDSRSIACALHSHGILLWKQKEYAAARTCCEEALALFRTLGDRCAVADALHYLGHITINQDDYDAAQSFLDENVALCRELDDRIGLHDGLGDLGLLAYLRNDYPAARLYLEKSLLGFRQAASIPGAVAALNRLGDLARCQGDYAEAGSCYAESLRLYRDLGDKDEIPSLLHNSGYVALHRGDHSQAIALFREALAIQREMGNRSGIAECFAGIAAVLTAQGKVEEAAKLFGTSQALREATKSSVWPANQVEYARSAAVLKRSLDESTLDRLYQEGRDRTVELAIAQAMLDGPARPT